MSHLFVNVYTYVSSMTHACVTLLFPGDAKFVSVTLRLFKLPQEKKPVTEVVYNGGITDFEDSLKLDHEWTFTVRHRTVNVYPESTAFMVNNIPDQHSQSSTTSDQKTP